jgi:hypothetical protein
MRNFDDARDSFSRNFPHRHPSHKLFVLRDFIVLSLRVINKENKKARESWDVEAFSLVCALLPPQRSRAIRDNVNINEVSNG